MDVSSPPMEMQCQHQGPSTEQFEATGKKAGVHFLMASTVRALQSAAQDSNGPGWIMQECMTEFCQGVCATGHVLQLRWVRCLIQAWKGLLG